MKHARLISALAKVGIKAVQVLDYDKGQKTKPTNNWEARSLDGKEYICWFTQPAFDLKTEQFTPDILNAVCVCSPHPDTDSQSDLFMDTFHYTIKAAVKALV